jgi:hypothetical protein
VIAPDTRDRLLRREALGADHTLVEGTRLFAVTPIARHISVFVTSSVGSKNAFARMTT